MSNAKNGGPAFPPPRHYTDPGMSLRDYFAAQAPEPPEDWWGRGLERLRRLRLVELSVC